MTQIFDRATQDVGNIIALEHVNTRVADPSLAHLFYVSGMGFTRDPYIDFGIRNLWVNLGRQQFHLPVGEPQVLRGVTGIVVPSLRALEQRLERIAEPLRDTRLAWRAEGERLHVTCPWGNRLEVSEPGGLGDLRLGMPYVRFDVPPGTADGIARFYDQIIGAPAGVVAEAGETLARVSVGGGQALEFRETGDDIPPYDGHHIAVYIAQFSRPHRLLAERALVTQESSAWQYRFQAIVDPDSGQVLFEIEHEVRSLRHPLYARPMVNRDPAQTNVDYVSGRDALPV
jgi:catechol-2,3-dioxygenase